MVGHLSIVLVLKDANIGCTDERLGDSNQQDSLTT